MEIKIKILNKLIERFKQARKSCTGKLYGTFVENTLIVLGLQVQSKDLIDLTYNVPAEIDFCGTFDIYKHENKENHKMSEHGYEIKRHYRRIVTECKAVEVTDNPVYIQINYLENTTNAEPLETTHKIFCHVISNDKIHTVPYVIVSEEEIYSEFVHLRLRGKLTIKCEFNDEEIKKSFASLRNTMASGNLVFKVANLHVLITDNLETSSVGLSDNMSIGELLATLEKSTNDGQKKKKNLEQSLQLKYINIDMYRIATKNDENVNGAPIIILNTESNTAINLPIRIDFLAMVHVNKKCSESYKVLVEVINRNLRLYENCFYNYLATVGELQPEEGCAESKHFFPKEINHFITRIIFGEEVCMSKQCMSKQREKLHIALLLTEKYPIFQSSNRYNFAPPISNSPLRNPHLSVKLTNNGGEVCLIRGNYDYYHYCQGNVNDDGWGCAYRSLQTLASWLRLQGYTHKSVPTIEEIQQTLVAIKDKPFSFLNSKQWIGSMEVCYVLNHLYDISSKILNLKSGKEMREQGPALVDHFNIFGSPIMIGGSVLAHTILGVDYNRDTENIKFLILDPHYKGTEDLSVILKKGFCGWKGMEFWKEDCETIGTGDSVTRLFGDIPSVFDKGVLFTSYNWSLTWGSN